MSDWKQDVSKRIGNLKILLSEAQSALPPYLLERVATNLAALNLSEMESESLHAFFRGAFRAIGDAGCTDDSDPIVMAMLEIDDSIP